MHLNARRATKNPTRGMMEFTRINREVYETAVRKDTVKPWLNALNAVPRAALAPATFPKTAIPSTGINNPTKNRQCCGMHKDLDSRKSNKPMMKSVKISQGTPTSPVARVGRGTWKGITRNVTCSAIPSTTHPMALAINAVYTFAWG